MGKLQKIYNKMPIFIQNIYDVNWKYLDINSDCKTAGNIYQKPPKLLEMIKIAEKLSSEFPFVRVDLYNINGNIFFGEFTFYPWSGYVEFKPDEFDYTLGEKFNHYKKILSEMMLAKIIYKTFIFDLNYLN